MTHDRPVKGWICPADDCRKSVTVDQLLRYRIGWPVKDVGQWMVSGVCPHCGREIRFTKHGAYVATATPVPSPAPGPMRHPFVVRRRG